MTWWKKRNMKPYCCGGFSSAIEDAGGEGCGTIVCKDAQGELYFVKHYNVVWLSMLGEMKEKQIEFSVGSPNHPIGFKPFDFIQLNFCPICGYNLRRLIKQDHAHFAALAEAHKKFSQILGIR